MYKISVIIPVYNVEEYVNRFIDSVINQSYSDMEIIIVNDGSTDNSGAICEEYARRDKRIIYISKENKGLSCARNEALDIASGEWFCFLDSDDFLHKDALETMVRFLETDDVDILSCNLANVPKNVEPDIENAPNTVEFLHFTKDEFFLQNISNHFIGKLFKKEMFEGIRFPAGRNYEDVATIFRLYMKAYKIAHTNNFLYFYRMRENSITLTFSRKNIGDLQEAYRDAKSVLTGNSVLYNYYLLTLLYTLYSRALRMDRKDNVYFRQIEEYVYEESKKLFSVTNIKPYKGRSSMYKKLLLLKYHLVKPVVSMVDLIRKNKTKKIKFF